MKVFLFIHAATVGDTILSLDTLVADLLKYKSKDILILKGGARFDNAYSYIELALERYDFNFKYVDFYDFIREYEESDIMHIHYYNNNILRYTPTKYIKYISRKNVHQHIDILNMIDQSPSGKIYITQNRSDVEHISFAKYSSNLPNTKSITVNIDSARALNFDRKSWLSIIALLKYDTIKVLTFDRNMHIEDDRVSVIHLDNNIDHLANHIQSSKTFVSPNTGLIHLAYKIMDHKNILSITNYESVRGEYEFYNMKDTKKIIFGDRKYMKYCEKICRNELKLSYSEIKRVAKLINNLNYKEVEIYR